MSQRVEGLEGMRGLAAFLVYSHHFLLLFYPAFYFGPHTWVNHLFNPDLAVSWFFVHSGFVLAYKGHGISDQALRRYFRLVPVVLGSILLTYLFMKLGLTFHHQIESEWINRYLKFTPDFFEALYQSFYGVYFDFKSSTTYNPNLWTIGYEMIGSYLLFAILAVLKTFTPLLVLGVIISPWKGLMCFVLGAAIARMPKHRTANWILILIMIMGFALSDSSTYLRNIGAVLLMYALIQSTKVRHILAKPLFHFLGEISYSLYALHFLILVSFTSYMAIHPIWNYLATTVLLIISSYAMTKLIDKPGIKLAKKFSGLFFVNKPAGRTVT